MHDLGVTGKSSPDTLVQSLYQMPCVAFAAGLASGIKETKHVTNWSGFLSYVGEFNPRNKLHVSLLIYFENDGAPCCIVPLVQGRDFLEDIPQETTLLVAAGEDITAAVLNIASSKRSLFAILDGPNTAPGKTTTNKLQNLPSTKDAACYYPWLKAYNQDIGIDVPPSAAVAGKYCSNAITGGVWKSPPTTLRACSPIFPISQEQLVNLYEGHLNLITLVAPNETRICGAITLDRTSLTGQYVFVSLTCSMVTREVQRMLMPCYISPDATNVQAADAAIQNYLYTLWQQAVLCGERFQEGCFFSMRLFGGLSTARSESDSSKRLIVNVGLALLRPHEFIEIETKLREEADNGSYNS